MGWAPAGCPATVATFEQVRDTLSDLLEPLDLLDKVAIPVQPVRRPGRVVAARDLLEEGADLGDIAERQRRLRAAVAEATNGRFTLDLLYQNDEARDAVIAQARASLGLDSVPMPDGEGLRWDTEELSLTVRARLLGACGDALQISPNGGRRDARRRDAMARRADETARQFAPVDGAAAALIELGGLDYWKHDPDADPKFAVRLGAARAGRPSQFLDLYDTEDKPHPKTGLRRIDHRAQQAWRDVLRQFGVQRVRASFAGPTVAVPSPLNYVAVWLISQTRFGSRTGLRNHLPVMVWMASDTHEVRVTAPGFDGQWLPYAQALTTIAGLDVFTNRGRSAPEVLQFIEQTLRRDVLTMGDTLLLTHAQNLRGPWPWLTNKQLCPDQIRFGPAPTEPITEWPGLRHVRVRTLDDGETPECFAERDEVQGFSKGLWDLRVGGRVYGSTGPKPVTAQQATGNVSKLQPWSSAVRDHEASPDVQAWNPSLVELTVAAIQPHDNPLVWAAIAHELRFMASHYDEATLLPLPLHLASLVEDYVLPMRLAASPNGEL